MKPIIIIFGITGLVGLGLIAGGVDQIANRYSGTPVLATVTGCEVVGGGHSTDEECDGSWVIGGTLVGGGGHVVLGPIHGADSSEIGKTIHVRANGDVAHTSSIRIGIILLILGLGMALYSVYIILAAPRKLARRAASLGPQAA